MPLALAGRAVVFSVLAWPTLTILNGSDAVKGGILGACKEVNFFRTCHLLTLPFLGFVSISGSPEIC